MTTRPISESQLRGAVRTVADYPKPGITFYDITSLLNQPDYFRFVVDEGCRWIEARKIDKVVSVDARGFLYGAPIAYKLGLPITLARKNNKLPGPIFQKTITTEYSSETIAIQKEDVQAGEKIVIIDDIIATGGTLRAIAELLEEQGAIVDSFTAIIGLTFCNYQDILDNYDIKTVFNF